MTNRRRHRPSLVVGALLIAGAAVACTPVVTEQTPPAPPPSCSGQGGEAPPEPTPTPSDPVDFVAVVDEPGAATPEVVTFSATSNAEVDAVVADLEESGEVLVVEPDQTVTALDVFPNDDPYYTTPSPGLYGLKPTASDFETAWATATGAGVTIAIVDSGVLATHEDLVGRVDTVNGTDYVSGSGNGTSDPYGHGTHVAGIVAASDNAVGVIGGAPDATILPIRVLGSAGTGSMSNVVLGVNYAVTHDADVINLSLGSNACSGALETAIQGAIDQGVVVVAAAGNCATGCGSANRPTYPAATADIDELIAVGATTASNTPASFSNSNSYVDVWAPGSGVWSTYKHSDSSYFQLSGTSMATPHVAAAAALALELCPGLTPSEVQDLLVSTTVPVTGGAPGQGLLQADLAAADAC